MVGDRTHHGEHGIIQRIVEPLHCTPEMHIRPYASYTSTITTKRAREQPGCHLKVERKSRSQERRRRRKVNR